MLNGQLEVADMVDGHTADRLYHLQSHPEAYQALWHKLHEEAERLNAEIARRENARS
jgi:hypothetical protein